METHHLLNFALILAPNKNRIRTTYIGPYIPKKRRMNKIKIEIKWAFIFILMGLIWMFMERLFGLHDEHISKHAMYTNFIAIPAILIYVLALLDKRKNYYRGIMTYKHGFISGSIITLIIALLIPFSQYITSTIITPDYFTNAINYTVESGEMNKEEAQDFFKLNNYIVQGFIGSLVMGVLTTAIVAIFTRKRMEN